MCTNSVDILVQQNVNDIGLSPLEAGTILDACQQQGPLPLCLVPPSSRLQTMCNATALLPTLFEKVLKGDIKTLDDLPVVWDTLLDPDDGKSEWIRESVDPNMYISDTDYYGLHPLPKFNDIAVANSFKAFWGVAQGYLYQSKESGFVERHPTVYGEDSDKQNVLLTPDGALGVVMFEHNMFIYNESKFVPIPPEFNDLVYHNMEHGQYSFTPAPGQPSQQRHVFFICGQRRNSNSLNDQHVLLRCYICDEEAFQSARIAVVNMPFAMELQWSGFSDGGTKILFAVADTPFGSRMQVFEWDYLSNIPPAKKYEFTYDFDPGDDQFSRSERWRTVISQNNTSERFEIFTAGQTTKRLLRFTLPYNPNTSNPGYWEVLSTSTTRISKSAAGNRFCYTVEDTNAFFVVQLPNPTVFNPNNIGGVLVETPTPGLSVELAHTLEFFPDGSRICCFTTDRKLVFSDILPTSPLAFGTPQWNETFKLHTNEAVCVRDSGMKTLPQPMSVWFFTSYFSTNVAVAGQTYMSPHQYYRFVIDSQIVSNATSFPHVSTYLERCNLSYRIRQSSQTLLYENSNLTTFISPANFWSRNTNDQFSSTSSVEINSAQLLDEYKPFGTRNGLYILYKPKLESTSTLNQQRGIRLALNIYNSPAFAAYCTGNQERLTRALKRQTEFCTRNLRQTIVRNGQEDDTTVSDVVFSDERCNCLLSGSDMMAVAFPGRTFTSITQARLDDNLPCILNQCQNVITIPELTNVYNAITAKCLTSPLTLCAAVITQADPDDDMKIDQAVVIQNCGASLTRCGQDTHCPIGSHCVNGTCVLDCKLNTDCILGATCEAGVCIAPGIIAQTPFQANINMWVAIILAVAVALFLLILFLILFLKKKPKKS